MTLLDFTGDEGMSSTAPQVGAAELLAIRAWVVERLAEATITVNAGISAQRAHLEDRTSEFTRNLEIVSGTFRDRLEANVATALAQQSSAADYARQQLAT